MGKGDDLRQPGIYYHTGHLFHEAFGLKSKSKEINDAGIFYGHDKWQVMKT